jgi:4-carboxymuconolactone decarboxylase
MARIPLLTGENLTPEQQAVYNKVISGPRGAVVGPLRAALHVPELADRWQNLGEYIRFRTSLPPVLSELAILVTAYRWRSQLEWHIHSQAAAKAGITADVIEAIRKGEAPLLPDPSQAAVFEFTRQLQQSGVVSDAAYDEAYRCLGTAGLVELTAVTGYYTMVALTLNAHHIYPPRGEQHGGERPLASDTAPLPPARRAEEA